MAALCSTNALAILALCHDVQRNGYQRVYVCKMHGKCECNPAEVMRFQLTIACRGSFAARSLFMRMSLCQ